MGSSGVFTDKDTTASDEDNSENLNPVLKPSVSIQQLEIIFGPVIERKVMERKCPKECKLSDEREIELRRSWQSGDRTKLCPKCDGELVDGREVTVNDLKGWSDFTMWEKLEFYKICGLSLRFYLLVAIGISGYFNLHLLCFGSGGVTEKLAQIVIHRG